jgi:TatD DNase family protein
MTLTDTHCHLNFHKFNDDRPAVIRRARDAGLIRILVPGLDQTSSLDAVKLAESDPMIYAAVGFHPTDIEKLNEDTFNKISELATHQKVVAVGEIGLDYYWIKEEEKRYIQRQTLKRQLALAESIHKPVIIHAREQNDAEHGACAEDLIMILGEWAAALKSRKDALAERPGVLHSFSGSLETATRAIDLGFYIGVTGPVTYKNAERRRQVVGALPLERLLIETDAPFLAPFPHRGKRNEPAFVAHIADKIAEIKSRTPQEIAAVTSANASRLFSLGETF